MSSAHTPDRDTAIARDADHLAEVIDCYGRAGAVARQRWEFLHRTVRLPDRCSELQDLEKSIASWIVDPILSPPDHLAFVIDAGGVAAITARERLQCCHLPVLPTETFADLPTRNTRGEEGITRKKLAKGREVSRFRDTHDHAIVTLDRPGHGAVWSPEVAQRDGLSIQPKSSDRRQVSPGSPVYRYFHPGEE